MFRSTRNIHYGRVKNQICQFSPNRKYRTEYEYQAEFVGWLKHVFPHVRTEVQTKSSRPDLVIDNIAIEIKGPTRKRDLESIPSKIVRYLNHYDHLIIVLLDLNINDKYYDDWHSGMNKQFPEVEIYSELNFKFK